MNITDYFPVGTKIVIEVVEANGCDDCIFSNINSYCFPSFC